MLPKNYFPAPCASLCKSLWPALRRVAQPLEDNTVLKRITGNWRARAIPTCTARGARQRARFLHSRAGARGPARISAGGIISLLYVPRCKSRFVRGSLFRPANAGTPGLRQAPVPQCLFREVAGSRRCSPRPRQVDTRDRCAYSWRPAGRSLSVLVQLPIVLFRAGEERFLKAGSRGCGARAGTWGRGSCACRRGGGERVGQGNGGEHYSPKSAPHDPFDSDSMLSKTFGVARIVRARPSQYAG